MKRTSKMEVYVGKSGMIFDAIVNHYLGGRLIALAKALGAQVRVRIDDGGRGEGPLH